MDLMDEEELVDKLFTLTKTLTRNQTTHLNHLIILPKEYRLVKNETRNLGAQTMNLTKQEELVVQLVIFTINENPTNIKDIYGTFQTLAESLKLDWLLITLRVLSHLRESYAKKEKEETNKVG